MKIVIRRLCAAFVMGSILAGPALAAPGATCKQATEIAAFADVLLARPHYPPLPDKRIHDPEIAYAKIKYGGLDRAAAHALLNTLPAPRLADANSSLELYLVTVETAGGRLKMLEPQVHVSIKSFLLQSVGYLRAVALDGNLASLVAAARRDPEMIEQPKLMTTFFGIALSGTDDPTKAKLAAQLEQMGLSEISATVLASEDDIQPWLRYVRDHPQSYPPTHRLAYWFANDGGPELRRLGFNGLSAPLSLGIADKDILDMMAVEENLSYPLGLWFRRVASLEYIGAEPLLALFQQIEEGEVAADDTDAVVVAFLANLDATIGRRKRDDLLEKAGLFDLHLLSQDADQFPLPGYFDTALARQALLPYLTGRIRTPPPRPDMMSVYFPWEQWLAAAQRIRDHQRPGGDVYIAAELLQLSGRGLESAALLLPLARAGKDLPYLTAHTTKMLASLMRACGEESMGLDTITPLYRFDAH